jgi:hypothetical protein
MLTGLFIVYCEIIINHGVLIFADFMVHLNHEFKKPWINGFCRKHENWNQQIKVPSTVLHLSYQSRTEFINILSSMH